ncbi:hypothetical protein NLU13_5970 [Sarocladium strictum]|uniref:Uncharacterized protein n=1 Tax=Sarocladium strictum TaxID=5046 RepID=A0AA39L6N7_SARSR|nr:hypothetical protein NLU13_5970 [Sarocladium strictum]
MKDFVIALSLVATVVAAQQFISAPRAVFKRVSSLDLGGIFAEKDGYQICVDAGDLILECGERWGGPDEIANLPPDEIFGCACCDSGRPVYSDYQSCSSYMASEMAGLTSEADVYGQLATMCSAMGSCSGRASSATATATGTRPTRTSASNIPSTITRENSETITAAVAVTECTQMLDMFSSCILETPRFTDLGYKSQAECYCCASSRGQTTGTLTWTDEIDQYASVCWNWAKSGATNTDWGYASTFATFCDNFSDVCNGVSVTVNAAGETETDSSSSSENTGAVTVTVTGGSQSTASDEPGAAAGLRAGCAGGLVAVVAGLFML